MRVARLVMAHALAPRVIVVIAKMLRIFSLISTTNVSVKIFYMFVIVKKISIFKIIVIVTECLGLFP